MAAHGGSCAARLLLAAVFQVPPLVAARGSRRDVRRGRGLAVVVVVVVDDAKLSALSGFRNLPRICRFSRHYHTSYCSEGTYHNIS
jgi:hypothetical protein